MSAEKRRFIQQATVSFVVSHPAKPDSDTAIRWSENLWGKLSEKGYGFAKGEKKPRVGVDHYAKLSVNQQKWFCLFWTNFKLPQAKQDAAERWAQLGEIKDDEYKVICDAAKAEALRALPQGQVRKMAAGWLHERRWEDAKPVPVAGKRPDNGRDLEIREAVQDLHQQQAMYKQTGDEGYIEIIANCEKKLASLRGGA